MNRKSLIHKEKNSLYTLDGNAYLLLLPLNYIFKTIEDNKFFRKIFALDKKMGRWKIFEKRSWTAAGFSPVNQVRFADSGISPSRFYGTFQ